MSVIENSLKYIDIFSGAGGIGFYWKARRGERFPF